MYSDRQTSQGGSVAIFLIVAAVFVALVVGGMYAVQNRSKQAQTATPAPVAQNPASTTSPQQSDQQKQADEAKKKQQEQQAAADAQKKAQEQALAEKQAQEAKKKQEEQAKQNAAKAQAPATVPQTSTAPAPSAATAPSSSNLPTTGPEDNLIQVVGGGVMVAILGAYLKSYRHRFGSLLR